MSARMTPFVRQCVRKKVREFLVARMLDRKYRFQKLILSVNYNKQGPYHIKNIGINQIEATLRWTGKTVLITVPTNSKVHVDIQHSTLRARAKIGRKCFGPFSHRKVTPSPKYL